MTSKLARACAVVLVATTALVPSTTFASEPRLSTATRPTESVEQVARLSPAEVDAAAKASGFATAPAARYTVVLYRVVYRTTDWKGRPTTASGLVVVPEGRRGRLKAVEYLHGTTATKSGVASVNPKAMDRAIATMFAGAGLVAVAPDYLGLGLGPGRPPYLDLPTETSSSLDLLTTADRFLPRYGVQLDRDVLVTGFSQGGRATLAVSRALQRGEAGRFRPGGIAPVGGPYDLLGIEFPAVFAGQVPEALATIYLAYLSTAWDHTIGLYDRPSEAFRPEYAATIEALFDGTHTNEEIGAGVPRTLDALFTPAFLDRLKHPTGRLRRALAVGDRICRDWTPKIPVHLYVGGRDHDVVPANATSCATNLTRRGAETRIHTYPEADHNASARLAYPDIIRTFAPVG